MRHRETEIKLRVADVDVIRRRLRNLGFRLVHRRSLEDNILFDTPDRALRKIRSILRLRHYGGNWLVTFKGTPAADSTYKSRLELETAVERPQAVQSIFEALGFRPVFRYQKYRTHYVPGEISKGRKSASEVALDETPIGIYLELEGSRRFIDRTAHGLGYSRADYITTSYGALYLEDCRKKKIAPTDMLISATFRNARGLKQTALAEKTLEPEQK